MCVSERRIYKYMTSTRVYEEDMEAPSLEESTRHIHAYSYMYTYVGHDFIPGILAQILLPCRVGAVAKPQPQSNHQS